EVLVDAMWQGGIQILVESHSERLLQRLQRRVAEASLQAEDVSLFFCELETGRNRLVELDVNEFGYIANWPQGFFGQPLEESIAMTTAAARRSRVTASS